MATTSEADERNDTCVHRVPADADTARLGGLQRMVSAYIDTWYPDGSPWSAADVALIAGLPGRVAAGTVTAWVAHAGTEPVGCVLLVPTDLPGVAEVSKMYVAPQWRGTGVAGMRMEALAGHAAANGVRRLALIVAAERSPARALYHRHGFADTTDAGTPPGFVAMSRAV